MVLNFKLDVSENLLSLYASSIRIEQNKTSKAKKISPLDLAENRFTVPETINIKTKSTSKPVKIEKEVFCRNCDKAMEPEKMFEIPYKFIINEALDKPGEQRLNSVVKIIRSPGREDEAQIIIQP